MGGGSKEENGLYIWTFPDLIFAGYTEGSEYRITLKAIKPEFELGSQDFGRFLD